MTVIMGGIHASVVTEEAANYVDAVFVGEAEEVWPQVIKDFEEGKLKKVYQGGLPPLSLMKKVYPNREFLKKKYNYKFRSEVWPQVIKDFEEGKLKKVYQGGLPPLSLMKKVYPNREFLKKKYNYKFSSIVTTKGCPNYCDFCSVPTFQGRKFRERPYEDVLDEMAATDYKGLMLAEDNFYGHGKKSNERARDLFKGMVERGIHKDWLGF